MAATVSETNHSHSKKNLALILKEKTEVAAQALRCALTRVAGIRCGSTEFHSPLAETDGNSVVVQFRTIGLPFLQQLSMAMGAFLLSNSEMIESLGAVYVWGELGSDAVSLLVSCNLLPHENGNGKARDGSDGALITEDCDKSVGLTVDPASAPTTPLTSTDKLYQSVTKNEKWPRIRADSIEDETWNLLHESIMYYCNLLEQLLANDWSSTSILNGDQRWEKTMDCPSPGQGLMPTSFKALFYSALLCASEMLAPEDGSADLIQALTNRMGALLFHIREYYWIDMKKLNEIYRYKIGIFI
ncbi:hypothetical protein Nepgr_021599 [Nepenthes gracilis]|uniref:Alkaline/neutral invertase n=1 Tax=Nepenthes gracilis TaxID=150966 RepID=A0AAD3SX24_NEPGR|nr:hypothetical protein Nepgr_021599 [Nepenthes gracilis]